MYNGWTSERAAIENDCGYSSVLNNYPSNVGKDVTSSVIRSLVHHPDEKKHFFKSDKDIEWTMDVICYGLTMPLDDIEMIKNCVFIYLDWMTVLSTKPKIGIPVQLSSKKEYFFTKMLHHLTNLFIPRDSTATVLQAKLCSQVLQQVRSIVQEGKLDKSTSEYILKFYLGISGHLLSVPPVQGGLTGHLCEQLLHSLLTVWLNICCYFFPSPSYWCTLREMVLSWRHHHVLVLQWNKLMYILTSKVLIILFGPHYPFPKLYADDPSEQIVLPAKLSDELTVQCWFRFLHIMGNPVSLSKMDEICDTEQFMQYSLLANKPAESHPSLKTLPESFYKAMKGISVLVGMFLGTKETADKRSFSISASSFPRGEWKSLSVGMLDRYKRYSGELKEKTVVSSGALKTTEESRPSRDDLRFPDYDFSGLAADTNCILHLFGAWLFDACLSGVDIEKVLPAIGIISCGSRPKSTYDQEQQSFPPPIKNDYELGRAQAFTTLCHIFCHQRITEHVILPVYLSRFYLSIAVGLCYGETRAGQILGSIMLTAENILQLDLQGGQILVPHLLTALELILPVPENELNLGYVFSVVNLRQACLRILLSMICLPLHFLSLPIQGLCADKIPHVSEGNNGFLPQVTFLSLKKRLTDLLKNALEVETNTTNTQIILGGCMLMATDTMYYESKKQRAVAELSKTSSLPNIVVNSSGSESPKLIHIAKAAPVKQEEKKEPETSKPKKNFPKNDIGVIGKKNDMLTTKGMFHYLTDFLCNKLMFAGKWRSDINVTLTALECLAGLAQYDAKFADEQSAKKALVWVCEYIDFQAKQPPPAHSKDLHSIIIAAFSCISTWLSHHPWLMDDHACLEAVLEVIELGISGSKSKVKPSEDTALLKGEKELKPVSFRVRNAAEALLALIMEQLGFFPTPNGASVTSALLDEGAFEDRIGKKFDYYAVDGSFIIGVVDVKFEELSGKIPSVLSIIRGPTGKRICLVQMKHFSRAKQNLAELYKDEPKRPNGLENIPPAPKASQLLFPPEVDRVQKIKADSSIPDLSEILDERNQELHEQMNTLITVQKNEESIAHKKRCDLIQNADDTDQKQPSPSNYDRASRLLLSHMGLLSIKNLQDSQSKHVRLQYLHNDELSLEESLKKLDLSPSRTYDTLYVLFVKKGQDEARDIISNKIPSLDNQFFMEFLNSLGWPVNLAQHKGWNGDIETSWQSNGSSDRKMFYYANMMTELAIHVPALNLDQEPYCNFRKTMSHDETKREEIPVFEVAEKTHRKLSDPDLRQRKITPQFEIAGSAEAKQRSYSCQSETKVLIAWLQHFEDYRSFPALDVMELCDPWYEYCNYNAQQVSSRVPEKEILMIFIHPLKTGLFRIKMKTVFGSSFGGPLIDGMVVSRRCLGTLVRETAINICKRRRLEIDSFSPPHVCRKMKIQKIIREQAQPTDHPEFYASLFQD